MDDEEIDDEEVDDDEVDDELGRLSDDKVSDVDKDVSWY